MLRQGALLREPARSGGVEVQMDPVVLLAAARGDRPEGTVRHFEQPVGESGFGVSAGEQGVLGLADGGLHQGTVDGRGAEAQLETSGA